MSKLYKAVDKQDGTMSCFLVNDKGVPVSDHCGNDIKEIASCKRCEDIFFLFEFGTI
ncbi:hypothetical protein [Klebsiella phage BUCT_49532]|uniref:hypothetical protein n=1 Tax=Klebsiella phage BUCT_49532 TaxID=2849971 RepID=UPI001C77CFDB|nr:hypothetical protein PQZ56_gp51 [Klebsiella phage BUCT_49532]WCI99747.1 hypothetical protein [Klebsiella phage BUCT_49532]